MRRTVTLVAIGLVAAAMPIVLGPGAGAEQELRQPSPRQSGTIEIGTIEQVDGALSHLTESEQVLTYPGADYVKVHFSRLVMAPGDYVTVSDVAGTESYRYDGPAEGLWTTSISGESAVVKLHTQDSVNELVSEYGVNVDKVARGFTDAEMDQRESERPRTESVCGRDDQLDAVCYRSSEPDVFANSAPVARLLIGGTTLCTAFRVGDNNRMLTNNHCFDSSAGARDTEVWFNYSCVTCQGNDVGEVVKVRGDKVLDTNQTYDYTLFTVDNFAAVEKFGSLTLSDRRSRVGEELYIPQHPSGDPTQVSIDSDADGGACKVDDPTFNGYATESDVSYFCDTEFGSSGSPVLSRETHEVIALHHFGGCPNSGVRSDKLLDRIQDKL